MNVLSVASEVYPLIKTGGLADVVGALPAALLPHGVKTRTLVPGYPAVLQKLKKKKKVGSFENLFGNPATVFAAEIDGLDLLVLDQPELYARDGGPYVDATGRDYVDNFRRFAALSLAAAEIAGGDVVSGWKPDIVHAHDWQTALTPVYMHFGPAAATPTVMTIHNIAFQGQFGALVFPELALPAEAFSMQFVEYYGDVGFLKGGLQTADAITTVSPSYAQEILTPEFGMGLEGLLKSRVADLSGIVNGIDADIWDPQTDPHIAQHFSATSLKQRAVNRRALEERFGLEKGNGPIFCVVSRLTWQKGMDLVAEIADELVAMGGKLVVLGSGDAALEGALLAAASRHRGHIGMVTGYNEPLSHLMQAGSDAILIPSRFEPCGLTQLYGLRYGCVPVVARTGGLADTIIDANEAGLAAKVATGFQFTPVNADGLRLAIRRALRAYSEPKVWSKIQTQGMKSDVSWATSAERYVSLYSGLLGKG
ncbi:MULTISPECIES: glycogen synthase GlgA [unclassified Ensifer]|uniref:glycogen synthase GlgA n=1 Tax=unclassified Ensifer TaxID=2633371 RepID=UPI000713B44D|nr:MULTISPECIES: glycogen synthase GlgA [unclassified Ensifer]KQX57654.1 glycogen synthase [Ensifer sp. Root1298]KQX92816.1 glycogen synthase [Ensifer sp. Root1312]KRC28587.1 glycogen synthase [Ensifer sp. Root74]KRD78534.1 glycogen synthase [Ensifer sp. Root954]